MERTNSVALDLLFLSGELHEHIQSATMSWTLPLWALPSKRRSIRLEGERGRKLNKIYPPYQNIATTDLIDFYGFALSLAEVLHIYLTIQDDIAKEKSLNSVAEKNERIRMIVSRCAPTSMSNLIAASVCR